MTLTNGSKVITATGDTMLIIDVRDGHIMIARSLTGRGTMHLHIDNVIRKAR